jgi:FG-GAP-like repeat
VLLGNGDGSFAAAVDYAPGDGPVSVAVVDLDGDGDLDLVVTNLVDNNVSVLLNTLND